MEVIDYSWSVPSPGTIASHGYAGVMRYLSGGTSKDLTVAERDGLFAAGLEIGLVWETSGTRMNGGYPAGASDAQAANRQADGLGFPARPIYFANDQNACTDTHVDYMRGARDNSGRPVGPYGNTLLIDRCTGELGLHWGWKVSTWGGGTGNAALVQEANWAPTIGGTDRNSVQRDDWGQWHGDPASTKPQKHPNPGVSGMMLKDETSPTVWLVGPGSCTTVRNMDEFDQFRYIGVPYAGETNPLNIVAWAQKFGAKQIEGQPI